LPSYKTNLQVESYSILGWCFPVDRLFPIHLWFTSQFVLSPIDFLVAPREFWIRIAYNERHRSRWESFSEMSGCAEKKHHPLYNPSNVTIAAHDPSNKSINNRPQNVKNGQMPRKKLRRSSLGGGLVFGRWQIRERAMLWL
jgi:hypothetical protein